MNRLSLAFTALLTTACGAQQFGSVCDDPNAPELCGQTCDARPGAPATCGAGLHCSEDGFCDGQCGPALECPSGYTCTLDGRCSDDPSDNVDPGPGPDDDSCPAVQFTPMPVTPSIQLVLDQSGSMFETNPSYYDQMRQALVAPTTGVISSLESRAYFGSLLYTCNGNQNAFTTVPRAMNNASTIRASIDSKMNGTNTPTAAAINAAVQSFAANPPPANSPPVIVLATDGFPNSCNGDNNPEASSVQAARNAFNAGIPVYVLAINQNAQHFQDLANAGQGHVAGQPNIPYYPTTNAAQLEAAFQTIINGVISCDLELTSPIDEDKASQGTVTINGQTIQFGTDWTLVNGNIIRVQGAACQTLKTTPNSQVDAEFPCGAVIL